MRSPIRGSVLAAVLATMLGSTAFGQIPFDFSDRFYRANGLEPKLFDARIHHTDPNATWDKKPDADHNHTRIIEINGGYDSVGALLYYPAPPANISAQAFQNNQTGQEAMEIANRFRAFIFPKRDGDPLSPMPPNRRHDNVFDTSSGYGTRNPLGLWRLTFPRWTDLALESEEGEAHLEMLRERNGTDLDGTPILKRLSEILEAEELGYLELLQRKEDGSEGFPWVV